MSNLYLPVSAKGSVAISVCPRCQKKMQYADLRQDPNNKQWYCGECVDIYDPWRLPARRAEDISLQHPRPDVTVADAEDEVLSNEANIHLDFPPEVSV